jgi:regulator of protease activity HflC (stomatin/prohibitin superfamily)
VFFKKNKRNWSDKMYKTRKDTHKTLRKKKLRKWLIVSLTSGSMFGLTYVTGNTYALLSDQASFSKGMRAASVFPSTLQNITNNLPSLNQKKKYTDEQLNVMKDQASEREQEFNSYFKEVQTEYNQLMGVYNLLNTHNMNPDSLKQITSDESNEAVNTVKNYLMESNSPVDYLLLSDEEKYQGLLSGLLKGEIAPYTLVLYLEQTESFKNDINNSLSTYIETFQLEVESNKRVFDYVQSYYNDFENRKDSLLKEIARAKAENERIRREQEELAKKQAEEAKRKAEEAKKKAEEEKKHKEAENEKQNKDQENNSSSSKESQQKQDTSSGDSQNKNNDQNNNVNKDQSQSQPTNSNQ